MSPLGRNSTQCRARTLAFGEPSRRCAHGATKVAVVGTRRLDLCLTHVKCLQRGTLNICDHPEHDCLGRTTGGWNRCLCGRPPKLPADLAQAVVDRLTLMDFAGEVRDRILEMNR